MHEYFVLSFSLRHIFKGFWEESCENEHWLPAELKYKRKLELSGTRHPWCIFSDPRRMKINLASVFLSVYVYSLENLMKWQMLSHTRVISGQVYSVALFTLQFTVCLVLYRRGPSHFRPCEVIKAELSGDVGSHPHIVTTCICCWHWLWCLPLVQ